MQFGPAARFLLKCLAASLLCLSIAHAAANSIIWKKGDQIVQLADQGDGAALPNDHPINTTPNEIAAMLGMLRIRYVDDDAEAAPTSLFTQEEIDNLGKAIKAGLGRAAPSQDIIFHVIGAHRASPGAWLKRNRVSAGRIFFRDGHLNIIFGQVQTPYRKKNIYGQINEDFYPRNYGSRDSATNHDVNLLTSAGIQPHKKDGEVRNDWIVISPSAATPAMADKKLDNEPVVIAAPAAEIAGQSSEPDAPVASESVKEIDRTDKPSDGLTPAATEIEARLEALKRLRERELISEEAYQAKVKEILQDL